MPCIAKVSLDNELTLQKKNCFKKCLKKIKLDAELLFREMVQVACDVQVTPFYGTGNAYKRTSS